MARAVDDVIDDLSYPDDQELVLGITAARWIRP
jgi:hypothetical protein